MLIDNDKPHYIPRLGNLQQCVYRHMRQLVDTQVRKYGLCIIKVLQFHVLTVSLAVKLLHMLLAGRVKFLSSQCLLRKCNIASQENTYGQTFDTNIILCII